MLRTSSLTPNQNSYTKWSRRLTKKVSERPTTQKSLTSHKNVVAQPIYIPRSSLSSLPLSSTAKLSTAGLRGCRAFFAVPGWVSTFPWSTLVWLYLATTTVGRLCSYQYEDNGPVRACKPHTSHPQPNSYKRSWPKLFSCSFTS